MDQGFIDVLRKIVAERGREVLLDSEKCKAFLADYAGADYKKERRLISFAAESGVLKAIAEADDLALCRQRQIMILGDEHLLKEEAAADIFDALVPVLRDVEKAKNVCENCGGELQERWERCPFCPVSATAATPAPAIPRTAPASGLPPVAPPGKGKKRKLNALIAALAGLVFVLALALVLTNRPERETAVEFFFHGGEAPVIELVRVEGGTFRMGCDTCCFNASPVRSVTVSGFYMGRFEVTQGEWFYVMGTWPGWFTGANAYEFLSRNPIAVTPAFDRRNLPVESVSWYDALVFSNRLSIIRGLSPAYSIGSSTNPDDWGPVPTARNEIWDAVTIVPGSNGYRLPTEAQWEFAARGGTVCRGNFTFSGSDVAGDVAWHVWNSGGRTHEVGQLWPNALGLYDMSGNVSEWVWDWQSTYPDFPETDPSGASSGGSRGLRGDNLHGTDWFLRLAYRGGGVPAIRFSDIGFRVVRP